MPSLLPHSHCEGYMLLLLLLSRIGCVRLCATPQTAANQALPSLGFSRQEYISEVIDQGIINLAVNILELARDPPVLGSQPPLGLVSPHLENLCYYFSRDLISYISYGDVGGLSLNHISWRSAIQGQGYYVPLIQNFNSFLHFMLLPCLLWDFFCL